MKLKLEIRNLKNMEYEELQKMSFEFQISNFK
jgi:hypothetical protein